MLERLARTMYRRRRRVLVAWIVALIGTFALSGAIGGAFHTEFKLPGTESQAAFDLLEQSSFRDRQVQGQIVFKADDGVTDPAVQSAMEGLFDEIQSTIPNVAVVSPYSARRRPADRAQRSQRRLRRGQLRRPLQRGVPGRRQEDQGAGRRRSTCPVWRSTTAATCSPRTRSAASPKPSVSSRRWSSC